MNEICKILPGIGLGPFHFGMSEGDATATLGSDFIRSEFEDGDFHVSNRERSICLIFRPSEGEGLQAIEIDDRCPCYLLGQTIFPNTRAGVVEFLVKELGADVDIELDDDELTRHLHVESLGMRFFLDSEDRLTDILWRPIVGDERQAKAAASGSSEVGRATGFSTS